jgi:flagellar biogenesis protein FliO
MGKITKSSCNSGFHHVAATMRLTIGIIALGCIVVQGNALLQAEAPPALIISKDGANVNVSLDSQASSDVSIRRSDDLMMIRVPKSFPSKLVIDPSLKKDDVVQETDTEGGKTILIHSQQIYLMTRENLQENTTNKATAPENHAKNNAHQSAAEQHANLHTAIDTGNPNADKHIHPVSQAASKSKTQEKLHQPPTIPLTIPSILPKTEELAPQTQTSAKPEAKSKDTTAAKKVEKPITKPDSSKPVTVDPESLPIDLSGKEQTTASQQSTSLMIRITLSLVAVLALLIGFIQGVLPKLMERYPAFFENLQEQARLKQKASTQFSKDNLEPAVTQRRSMKSGILFRSLPKLSFNAPVKYEPDSKRQYLERMNVNGNRLTVLSSASLGKGSELHLVEVQDRQLVIATTPYTVSFVKELTEPTFESSAAAYDTPVFCDETSSNLPEPAAISGSLWPDEPAEEKAQATPDNQTTIAYLSDDSPVIAPQPQSSKKPYASVPHTAQQAAMEPPGIQPAAVANIATHDAVYQKYLNSTGHPRPIPTEMAPDPKAAAATSLPAPSYVDAEEVIVLEDYDDVYGR